MNTEHTHRYNNPAPDAARPDFLHPERRDPSPGPIVAAGSFREVAPGVRKGSQESAMKENAMTEDRINATSRIAARVAILIVGIVLALAVGAPFLLNDAPPSPEAVFATKVCCIKVSNAIAARPAPMVAPAK
jgi:hypothetical protein